MLSKLLIQNYAIIEKIEIDFTDHLNIITGETGAGKSILVGALGLVLGDRADTAVLMDKEKKAIVEAVFSVGDVSIIEPLLNQWEIEAASEVIIRREVSSNGKSRAFVNDTPVNLTQLNQLSACLVDLHQQFDTHRLGRDDFQREVIDALAAHHQVLGDFQKAFHSHTDALRKLSQRKEEAASFNRELDYQQFLFDELAEANFRENELEELEAELKILSHAENIKAVLARIQSSFVDSEQPVVQSIKSILQQLNSIAAYHNEIPALSARLQSAFIEIQDISDELELLNDKVLMDEARIDEVQSRLSLGQKLLKKHHVQHTNELLAIQVTLEKQLSNVMQAGEEIKLLEIKVKETQDAALSLAQKLSINRKKQVKPLEENCGELLKRVGMPNARLKIDIKEAALHQGGTDQISFLFDANKSNRFEPLQKVASGGELSRLMLSLKSLVAHSVNMPTLIFDEIDSGISGEAARQVGILMKELGNKHQVLSITHQPQIAARADAHFYVFKKEVRGKINTQIHKLNHGERIEAIAKMLGGEPPSAVALENAREMVAG
jgi:DNA repair protein RecN (Recombination protein N)